MIGIVVTYVGIDFRYIYNATLQFHPAVADSAFSFVSRLHRQKGAIKSTVADILTIMIRVTNVTFSILNI